MCVCIKLANNSTKMLQKNLISFMLPLHSDDGYATAHLFHYLFFIFPICVLISYQSAL